MDDIKFNYNIQLLGGHPKYFGLSTDQSIDDFLKSSNEIFFSSKDYRNYVDCIFDVNVALKVLETRANHYQSDNSTDEFMIVSQLNPRLIEATNTDQTDISWNEFMIMKIFLVKRTEYATGKLNYIAMAIVNTNHELTNHNE